MSDTIWMYWQGECPSVIRMCQQTVFANRGKFNVVVITPDTILKYAPDLEKSLESEWSPGYLADLLRSSLLYHHGGVWLDCDVVLMRPLDWLYDICHDGRSAIASRRVGIELCLMASSKGNAFFGDWYNACRERSENRTPEIRYGILGNLLLRKYQKHPEVEVIDPWRIAPIRGPKSNILFDPRKRSVVKKYIPEDTHGVHLYYAASNKLLSSMSTTDVMSEQTLMGQCIGIAIEGNW